MAKDRNIVCAFFVCHCECSISNKECDIKSMQHCPMYEAAKDRKPYRENRKRARQEKEKNKRGWD